MLFLPWDAVLRLPIWIFHESVVEEIIIGGYNEEGVEEPLKITFVYKNCVYIVAPTHVETIALLQKRV